MNTASCRVTIADEWFHLDATRQSTTVFRVVNILREPVEDAIT
jgi:hypothetical protein